MLVQQTKPMSTNTLVMLRFWQRLPPSLLCLPTHSTHSKFLLSKKIIQLYIEKLFALSKAGQYTTTFMLFQIRIYLQQENSYNLYSANKDTTSHQKVKEITSPTGKPFAFISPWIHPSLWSWGSSLLVCMKLLLSLLKYLHLSSWLFPFFTLLILSPTVLHGIKHMAAWG